MSQEIQTQGRKPSLLEQLSTLQIILALAFLLGGGAVGALVVQGDTTLRLTAVEKQNDKQEKGLDDIRDKMISKSDLDALLRELGLIREEAKDIRGDVKEIRAEQLRQAKERR